VLGKHKTELELNEHFLEIRVRRSTTVAVIVSILVHLFVLWLAAYEHLLDRQGSGPSNQPLTVNFYHPPHSAPMETHAPPPAQPAPVPVPVRHEKTPPRKVEKTRPSQPSVMASPVPQQKGVPPPVKTPPAPEPAKAAPLDPASFPDMASYLKAMRERRGDDGSSEPAHAASEDEARMANIQRNLQLPGTNGVFQITRMDAHTATFSFRGWRNDYSTAHRESYQVEAKIGEDIQRAIVRKMIEIIRRYFNGDFNWESIRLGRVVVLSARLQDNDGLEDFMIQEFFGSQ
jgi:hypothetical protein